MTSPCDSSASDRDPVALITAPDAMVMLVKVKTAMPPESTPVKLVGPGPVKVMVVVLIV
jgi:hypothetical protein